MDGWIVGGWIVDGERTQPDRVSYEMMHNFTINH